MKSIQMTGFLSAALCLASGLASADLASAQKNGCMACHDVNATAVGPSFKAVAAKYKGKAGAEKHLVAAIKNGSEGVWGDMPMPPRPKVSDTEAQSIAKWILSL